jgi:muramoyltetrapeptide carboxypeptidase LdcA involved in peptidoglycan recycling
MIESKQELANIPIIANVDFGHTNPLITYPIGGEVTINASGNNSNITITRQELLCQIMALRSRYFCLVYS